MQWRGRRQSKNVVDRRGIGGRTIAMGGRPLAVGGGTVGLIVVVVVVLLQVLGGGGATTDALDAHKAIYGYAAGLDMTRRDLQLVARDKGRPWTWARMWSSRPSAPRSWRCPA